MNVPVWLAVIEKWFGWPGMTSRLNRNSGTQNAWITSVEVRLNSIDRSVKLEITSVDVIHSFWVPEFLFKRDVIPGHPNHFAITATKTGTFTGHCSELCGLYHSKMLFTLKVVTPQQFKAYIAAQQAMQNSSGSTQ